MIVVMRLQGAPLITPFSNDGIVDLEFAWNENRFKGLMMLWNDQIVRTNLYLDFLFIAAYTWLLGTWCRQQTRRYTRRLPQLFAMAALLAGAFDVLENTCLLLRIGGWEQPLLLKAAALAAGTKFLLILGVLVFILFSLVFRRRTPVLPSI